MQERKGNHFLPLKLWCTKPVLYVRFHEVQTNFGTQVWNSYIIVIIRKNREYYLECFDNYRFYRQATRFPSFCYGGITVSMEEIQKVCGLTSGLRFSSLLAEVLYFKCQSLFIYLFSVSRGKKTKHILCTEQRPQTPKQHSDLSIF